MMAATFTGYVTGAPKTTDNENYGPSCEVSIRCKTDNGKQQHFVNARFYGKKISTVEKYIKDGDQMTVSGSISSIMPKKKADGTEYVNIYMNTVATFSIPPSPSGQSRSNQSFAQAPAPSPEEEEIPF